MKIATITILLLFSSFVLGKDCYIAGQDLNIKGISKCDFNAYLHPNDNNQDLNIPGKNIQLITGTCSNKRDKSLEEVTYISESGTTTLLTALLPSLKLVSKCKNHNKKRYYYNYGKKKNG